MPQCQPVLSELSSAVDGHLPHQQRPDATRSALPTAGFSAGRARPTTCLDHVTGTGSGREKHWAACHTVAGPLGNVCPLIITQAFV